MVSKPKAVIGRYWCLWFHGGNPLMTIAVGSRVPRRGNPATRWLGRLALRLMGWRHAGAIPDEPKLTLIGAPALRQPTPGSGS